MAVLYCKRAINFLSTFFGCCLPYEIDMKEFSRTERAFDIEERQGLLAPDEEMPIEMQAPRALTEDQVRDMLMRSRRIEYHDDDYHYDEPMTSTKSRFAPEEPTVKSSPFQLESAPEAEHYNDANANPNQDQDHDVNESSTPGNSSLSSTPTRRVDYYTLKAVQARADQLIYESSQLLGSNSPANRTLSYYDVTNGWDGAGNASVTARNGDLSSSSSSVNGTPSDRTKSYDRKDIDNFESSVMSESTENDLLAEMDKLLGDAAPTMLH
eukprot:TRINITY_DN74_c0_g1::TRINITY_DN74_c0_g1_i1::g.14807::m.14807 TRINITY_DN74_c0_g1::TRINITY_DN74_c0_g1_i1::g.14807  ORF type:complete len:291 (-),score=23.65 TRINITY_DN74_c0_g1_i1:1257-2060(-)